MGNRAIDICTQSQDGTDCGELFGRKMAERQGFEPWVLLPAQRFSRPPRSTTPAPLRKNQKCFLWSIGGRAGNYSKRSGPARVDLMLSWRFFAFSDARGAESVGETLTPTAQCVYKRRKREAEFSRAFVCAARGIRHGAGRKASISGVSGGHRRARN